MASSYSGLPVYADTAALGRLSRALRMAAPEAWRAYRVAAAKGAELVLEDAKARAAFSTRIPGSGRVRVSAAGNPAVVFTAPDASPIENRGKGFVRHPVFGNRENWTAKNSHPAFGAPALEARAAEVVALVEEGLARAVGRALDR